jgi:hypothetical protein
MNLFNNAIDERAGPRTPDSREKLASEELRLAHERLTAEFDGVFSRLKRSLYIEKRALGLTIFDTGYRVAGLAAVALSGLAIALLATLLVVASARRCIHLWTGDAWWSDMALAAVLLILLMSIAHALRRWIHRSTLAKTRRVLRDGQDPIPSSSPEKLS